MSFERPDVAEAETVENVEGTMCGTVMRGSVALPESETISRTNGPRRNLGGLVPPTAAAAVLGHNGKPRRRSRRGRSEESDGVILPGKRPNKAGVTWRRRTWREGPHLGGWVWRETGSGP